MSGKVLREKFPLQLAKQGLGSLNLKTAVEHESLHNPLTRLGHVKIDSSPKRCPRNLYIPYAHQLLAQLFRAQLPLLGSTTYNLK
jgi:hypothetical protein